MTQRLLVGTVALKMIRADRVVQAPHFVEYTVD